MSALTRPKSPIPRLALTPREAALSLGISIDYLTEHIAHELRWVRRGRKRLVDVRELERWLDREADRPLAEQVRVRTKAPAP